jgi:hypothetical protein
MTPKEPIGSREDPTPPPHSYWSTGRLEYTKTPPKTGGCYNFLIEKSLKRTFFDKNF